MAAQAPKKIASGTVSTRKSAYVQAANKLLQFAVNDVHYIPEPGEELIDERVESVDKRQEYFDNVFRHTPLNDTVTAKDPSIRCLNDMNKALPEIVDKTVRGSDPTRRSNWWWRMKDLWYEGYIDVQNMTNQTEPYKHNLVIKLCLAWYLNARRFIYRSLDMRKPIMEDKRYKIGFLFHALRMNVFDQHKLLQGMQQQEGNTNLRNFETTLLVYTKILRMNVDLNDIISYLRLLHYKQPDPPLRSAQNKKTLRVTKKKKDSII